MRREIAAALSCAAIVLTLATTWFVSPTTAQIAPTPGSATYRYDSLGQIVQDVYPANSGAYNYDAAGNRVTASQN